MSLLRVLHSLQSCNWKSGAVLEEWSDWLGPDFGLMRAQFQPTGTLAESYPCLNRGGGGCPRQVIPRGSGQWEAVCGNLPRECESVVLEKANVAVWRLDVAAGLAPFVAAIREREWLDPVSLPIDVECVPLGLLRRHEHQYLVIWGSAAGVVKSGGVRDLKEAASADGVIALVGVEGQESSPAPTLALLPVPAGTEEDLRLWRGLRLLAPDEWASRAVSNTATYEEVMLEMATEPGDRHIVRLNGRDMDTFHQSDQKFARLLLLAAARRHDRDVEGGGWVEKRNTLMVDPKGKDIQELREALGARMPGEFAGLTEAERAGIIKSGAKNEGRVRLAVHPRNIRFHESLSRFQLLNDAKARGEPVGRGQREFETSQATSRQRTMHLLAQARLRGAPIPESVGRR